MLLSLDNHFKVHNVAKSILVNDPKFGINWTKYFEIFEDLKEKYNRES